MKRYLIAFSLLFLLLGGHASAASLSDMFIAITDSKSAVTANDEASYKAQISILEGQYKQMPKKDAALEKQIKQDIELLKSTSDKDKRIETLQSLSAHLVAYEKVLNPIDKNQKKKDLKNALFPVIDKMEKHIQNNQLEKAMADNKLLNTAWTANEKIVRGDDIGRYGQIETQQMMIRIALTKETPDTKAALQHLEQLKDELNSYLSGDKAEQGKTQDASILSTYLNDAIQQIDDNDLEGAKQTLTTFVTTWPNVEGDIRNSNNALYSTIEQKIPDYAGSLSQNNKEEIQNELQTLKQDIDAAVNKDNYSAVDAALILLREGVEALLIVMSLITVARKASQKNAVLWIVIGSVIGLALSAVLAIAFNQLFSNVGQGRELLEAVIGICAVIFMIFIGQWLHSKSSLKNWQKFIDKNMTHAITSGSVLTFSLVSFLSVFREGAETLIFYAGIAGKISTSQLIIGIVAALLILALIAIFFERITKVIPIRQLFLMLSILIFVLAFKILGVSIHTFQVLGMIPNTTLSKIPFIQFIGLYPTLETLIPQIIMVLVVGIYLFFHYRGHQHTAAKKVVQH